MDKKKIAIILQHYSIVIKGVERKLKEIGYDVTLIDPEKDLLRAVSEQIDLFVLYLPKNSKDSEEEEATFTMVLQVCDVMKTYEKSMVLIGEKNYRDDLMAFNPLLKEYEWIDRPIDMKLLAQAFERALNGETNIKKQILIVDDDPTYASMVRTWIKDLYKTDILTSGKQISRFLEKKRVDLILLDYDMPQMDGSQVFKKLRSDSDTEDIPVVFLTGVGTADEVKHVLALKPDGYILKSATREQLLDYLADKFKKLQE